MRTDRVLIVTGGLITAKDRSLFQIVKKQITQWKAADAAWLDAKVKAVALEPLLAGQLEKRRTRDPEVRGYFDNHENFETPELTEVILATLLENEGMPYEVTTYGELFSNPNQAKKQLERCNCVFASSTLLRDLSEVEPLMRMLKRPDNHIVLGGALTGALSGKWEGMPEVELVAVGYGEWLVPCLVRWIRSGFRALQPPERGRVLEGSPTRWIHSGSPDSLDLDFLTRPDWQLAERVHGRKFRMVHYESVRGCPYRCSFCNYPYLFDDTRFRYKSAERIAADWQHYAAHGAEYITCLDSLFTMPRKRLVRLCELLIERKVGVKWICYARTSDLVKLEIAELMRAAGCIQVQIGLESADPQILQNMVKKCTVEDNARGIENCRKVGITSLVSLIVGFPGETEETLERTYQFMQNHPPDFFFLATFSTRVPGVPVLNERNRRRFGLISSDNAYAVSPYWVHDTMSCADVGNHVRRLQRRLMENQVSLDAALFYDGILSFRPEQRAALLEFQQKVAQRHRWVRRGFDKLHAWIDRKLGEDVQRFVSDNPRPLPLVPALSA